MDWLYRLYNEYNEGYIMKSMSRNSLLKPVVTDKLINNINARFRLFKQYKLDYIFFQYYIYFKVQVTSTLEQVNKKYFEGKFYRCSGSFKITWKLLNFLIFRKRKILINCVSFEFSLDLIILCYLMTWNLLSTLLVNFTRVNYKA